MVLGGSECQRTGKSPTVEGRKQVGRWEKMRQAGADLERGNFRSCTGEAYKS